MKKRIACVTGSSGMVGSRIVHCLIRQGYIVRALTRKKDLVLPDVDMHYGDICDEAVLRSFLDGANFLFHCASELNDESKMWQVNVLATKRILELSEEAKIRYFCYFSSAGVTGKTNLKLVDELSPCSPRNMYERSKMAAEKLVACGINECKTVILRPTNVVSEEKPGVLLLPCRRSLIDTCKVFLTGGECAHIIHAEDVAAAAVYLASYPQSEAVQCYIISCDQEPLNTPAGLWALYNAYCKGRPLDAVRPVLHLSMFVPYILRRIVRGGGNMGDALYSSRKLMETGFVFKLGLLGAVSRIASSHSSRTI